MRLPFKVDAHYRRTKDGYWEAFALDDWIRLTAQQCDALGLLKRKPAGPFAEPLMQCPDCGETFRADEYHDVYCGFPGHGALARWWKRRKR